MKNIKIPKCDDEQLSRQLNMLISIFQDINDGEKVNFDFSLSGWITPFLILPIAAYICDTGSSCSGCENPYLKCIKFPQGVENLNDFELSIQEQKSYVPISFLSKDSPDREKLEGVFLGKISRIVGKDVKAKDAIYYPVSELVTNIFEHSKKEIGGIFGQIYDTKNFLDICIVDRGRGLAKAYFEEEGKKYEDIVAIQEMIKGHSTKKEKERGYGVRTSRKVVCEGLGGGFSVISGSAGYYSFGAEQRVATLENFYWQGVIVGYRIPKPRKGINIYDYVEQ